MSEEKQNIKQGYDNIELRSEEVQEVLGRPPHWIIRWGICVIFSVILILFIGSFFFRYPDIITSEVTITTEHPATWVVARSTGKLQHLFVNDKQEVQEGELLAVIENPANYQDIQKLEKYLNSISSFYINNNADSLKLSKDNYSLGELQNSYSQLFSSIREYLHFIQQQYHLKKIAALKQELNSNISHKENLINQKQLQQENLQLIQNQFNRDSSLYIIKAVSLSEYETSRKQLISAKQALEQAKLSVSNSEISIDRLQQDITELELDYQDKMEAYRTSLKTNYDALQAAIKSWKQQFLLRASSSGIITFSNIWSQNQQINTGDKVFGIVAENQGEIIGKVQLPSEGIGKVKTGQRVNIKLDGYPYMEYGMLPAKVHSISLVPNEKIYSVQLSLPQNMKTFYGEKINFTGELNGIAEIATDEMSLFQRMLNPLKYFFKRNT